mgnify:CR=1 FL=1
MDMRPPLKRCFFMRKHNAGISPVAKHLFECGLFVSPYAMAKPKHQQIIFEILALPDFCERLIFSRSHNCLFQKIDGKYWRPLQPDEVKKTVWDFLTMAHAQDVDLTMGLLTDLYSQLRYAVPECNLDAEDHYLAFEDQLYDLHTFQFVPYDRVRVATFYFPFPSSALQQPHPTFDRFLSTALVQQEDTTEHDPSLAYFLQEMMGYFLSTSMKAAACLFLVGAGQNGKSTLTDLIESIFPDGYRIAMSIEALTADKYGSAALVGKKINICNEEESRYIRSDKFKAMISGDSITGERKYESSFTFKPRTKFVFCSNNMPTFEGVSHGLIRRIKIIPLYRKFSDHSTDRDPDMGAKMALEIPGIVGWALEGLHRLHQRRYAFPAESDQMARVGRDFTDSMSSALTFFRETYECSEDENDQILYKELYDKYKAWCVENGRKALSSNKFHYDISTNVEGIRNTVANSRRYRQVKPLSFDLMDGTPNIFGS